MVRPSAWYAQRHTDKLKLLPGYTPIYQEHPAPIVPLEKQMPTVASASLALPERYLLLATHAKIVPPARCLSFHLLYARIVPLERYLLPAMRAKIVPPARRLSFHILRARIARPGKRQQLEMIVQKRAPADIITRQQMNVFYIQRPAMLASSWALAQ